MQRAVTVAMASGWIGFLAVSAVVPALAVLRIANPGMPMPPILAGDVERLSKLVAAGGNGELLTATVVALALTMSATMLALAAWLTQQREGEDRDFGLHLALVTFVAVGIFAAVVRWSGSSMLDTAGSLPSFAAILCLSVVALLLDRMLDEEPPAGRNDDEDFRTALSLIGQEMARDAVMKARQRDRDGPKGDR